MKVLFIIIQLVSALGLIVLVMLHSVKGEGLGAIGMQARVFSSQKGLESGLNKITATFASIFMLSSFILRLIK